jgi:carboxylate-amine ligase
MSVDPESLRALFDGPAPMTIGVEEEVMLLDPATLDLAPRAREALAALGGDERFTLELPAAQLEIVLPPVATVPEAIERLGAARRDLASRLEGELRVAAAGVHPFAAPLGVLNDGERYERIAALFGDVARRQLVFALQVHVCVRGAERALAVHNALRGELPLVAALAAHAPVHAGRDTGLASVRPSIGELLPRQGVPPILASWDDYAARLSELPDPALWWWEVRPHPRFGTLEVRVPDAQATVADAAAVVAVVHALVARLAERFDAGEQLPAPAVEAVERDRAVAAREGAGGALRDRVLALLEDLGPTAERLGCADEFAGARRLVDDPPAERLRAAFARHGGRAVAELLADRFAGE